MFRGRRNIFLNRWNGAASVQDEGVGKGGDYAPYRQSDRKEIYKAYAEDLVRKGVRHIMPSTLPKNSTVSEKCRISGETFTYDYKVREQS